MDYEAFANEMDIVDAEIDTKNNRDDYLGRFLPTVHSYKLLQGMFVHLGN